VPTKRETFRVCDLCGLEPADEHRIVHNGKAVQLDLCADHARPLEELIERFALASTNAPGRSTSPYQCQLCPRVLSRRVHAAGHVQRVHGYSEEESYAHIRPAGPVVTQVLEGPSHQPHRCKVCKRPYVNASTAKRHIQQIHPERIRGRKRAADLIEPIENDSKG
jgi:hypothetical protein